MTVRERVTFFTYWKSDLNVSKVCPMSGGAAGGGIRGRKKYMEEVL